MYCCTYILFPSHVSTSELRKQKNNNTWYALAGLPTMKYVLCRRAELTITYLRALTYVRIACACT